MNEVDYFAGLAMQSLIKLQLPALNSDCGLDKAMHIISVNSYNIAAAMIKERAKRDISGDIIKGESLTDKYKNLSADDLCPDCGILRNENGKCLCS